MNHSMQCTWWFEVYHNCGHGHGQRSDVLVRLLRSPLGNADNQRSRESKGDETKADDLVSPISEVV
jgi:hypothetical protein